MTPEEFRALGHRVTDWVADYMQRIESFPVLSRARPGEVRAKLPAHPPQQGLEDAGWNEVIADLDRIILPGVTHWQSPSFFAFFPCNASGPAILGEILSAGLGIQGMLWATSPAATELETHMLDWLAEMIGLPDSFRSETKGGGCIQGTASESTLIAMVTARHRLWNEKRFDPARLVAYTSTQAHSSVLKATMIAGLCRNAAGGDGLRLVAVDENLRMNPHALAEAMRADRARGKIPFFVSATVGTTSSGAADPLPEIGAVLEREAGIGARPWLHVDAAWAGAAFVCPEHRGLLEGIEHADSFTFNPHKWLLTSFDCNAFWTRDRDAVVSALSVMPSYLRDRASESGEVIDYRDWQIPLGRRFRALKLWFVIRHFGVEGLQRHIREHVRLAALFTELVRGDDRFEIPLPPSLALVCFRLRPREREKGKDVDQRNLDILDRINASGEAYLSQTTLPLRGEGERVVLRFAIGSPATQERHVRAAWNLIRAN